MLDLQVQLQLLREEVNKLHLRHEQAASVTPDYYEPGKMEYLEQSDGQWDEETGRVQLWFEVQGTRYQGHSEMIELLSVGDPIIVERDKENPYNPNNFRLLTKFSEEVGNMPKELCNAIAPLFDGRLLRFENHATVSYVEHLSERSRHARKAVLFVKLDCTLSI